MSLQIQFILKINLNIIKIFDKKSVNDYGLYYGRTIGSFSRKSLRSVGSKVIKQSNKSLHSLSEFNINEATNDQENSLQKFNNHSCENIQLNVHLNNKNIFQKNNSIINESLNKEKVICGTSKLNPSFSESIFDT